MSDIAGFLLARAAEDDEAARAYGDDGTAGTWSHWALAMSEAKRRIVVAWADVPAEDDPYSRQVHETIGHVFRCLAAPYADHPDYRNEWRP